MSNSEDLRLIEDYLPIVAISAEAARSLDLVCKLFALVCGRRGERPGPDSVAAESGDRPARGGAGKRLVLIHFWAPWCKPCRQLEQGVFAQAETGKALDANFVMVKLNVDDSPATARMYYVSSPADRCDHHSERSPGGGTSQSTYAAAIHCGNESSRRRPPPFGRVRFACRCESAAGLQSLRRPRPRRRPHSQRLHSSRRPVNSPSLGSRVSLHSRAWLDSRRRPGSRLPTKPRLLPRKAA